MEHLAGQTHEELNTIFKYNESMINGHLEKQIQHFTSLFDVQQELIKNHIPGILDPYYGITPFKQVVLQSYFKNSDLLFTSSNLIIQGHFGAARIIMRQIFEFLLIGKYCCLTKKEGFINRWLDGKQINIYDEAIKKLLKPDKKEFDDFWIMICNFTHATTFSNQGSFNFKDNKDEITGTYYILLMLLCCNYHLLSSCVLDSKLIYRSNIFGEHRMRNADLKVKAREIITEVKKELAPKGIALIKTYCGSWKYAK
jgi:hypothetical protein